MSISFPDHGEGQHLQARKHRLWTIVPAEEMSVIIAFAFVEASLFCLAVVEFAARRSLLRSQSSAARARLDKARASTLATCACTCAGCFALSS